MPPRSPRRDGRAPHRVLYLRMDPDLHADLVRVLAHEIARRPAARPCLADVATEILARGIAARLARSARPEAP